MSHNSIYWTGAVYVIGGHYDSSNKISKIEIWDMKDFRYQFKKEENWPELLDRQ